MLWTMVVISSPDGWSFLVSQLQDKASPQPATFVPSGPGDAYRLKVDGVTLRYLPLEDNMTEQALSQAMDSCVMSGFDGVKAFLLLLRKGGYTWREQWMVEVLRAHFGDEALKDMVILSLDDGHADEKLNDDLLELINRCDRRFCRMASPAGHNELLGMIDMLQHMLLENGWSRFGGNPLDEARRDGAKPLAVGILDEEAEEQACACQREGRQARENMHAEESRRELQKRGQNATKAASLGEVVETSEAKMQLQRRGHGGIEPETMSVVLLGLSGSGKTSALNLILEIAGHQCLTSMSECEPLQSTFTCEKREAFVAGRRLILVDTPELWDVDGTEELELVKDCLALALPGPHVFLLVLQVGRFTRGECEMLAHLQRIFGKDFAERAIVLFVHVHGVWHYPQGIHEYVTGAHSTLQNLLRRCGSRYYELDLAESRQQKQQAQSCQQVKDLMSGAIKLVAAHGGQALQVRRFPLQDLQARRGLLEDKSDDK